MRRTDKIKGLFRRRSKSPSARSSSELVYSSVDESHPTADELVKKDALIPTENATEVDILGGLSPVSTSVCSLKKLPEEGSLYPPPAELGKKIVVDRWKYAQEQLDDEARDLLQAASQSIDGAVVLSDIQYLANEKQKIADKNSWKFDLGGRRIAIKDVATRMILWVKSFKDIGDTLVSIDPVHTALPWAAVKFIMQVVTADQAQMSLILVGLEQVLCLITRCKIYEQLYLDLEPMNKIQMDTMNELNKEIVKLYTKLLNFLSFYVQAMNRSSVHRTLDAFLNPTQISDLLSEVGKLEARTSTAANLCEKHGAAMAVQRMDDNFRKTRESLRALESQSSENMTLLWKKIDEDERVKILQWVSDVPYETDHYMARKGRIQGTGTWLIQHETYCSWRKADHSLVLWLHGIPGAGKTKLSSMVIDDLLEDLKEATSPLPAVAYFYCDRNRNDHQDPVAVLRSLIRQLGAPLDSPCIDACIESKYAEQKRKGFSQDRLVGEECRELLLQVAASQKETYLVLDGLDECSRDSRHILMDTLDLLLEKCEQSHPIKVYIASRPDQDLRERYEAGTYLQVTANDNQADIETYVLEKMKESEFCRTKMSQKVRRKVLQTFQDKSQGMFQWAVLQITELLALRRNQDILKFLDQLPRGLEDAYSQIYRQITSEPGSRRDIAIATFKILMASWRPLSPRELVVAATQSPELEFHLDQDIDLDYILDACQNLVVVADGSQERPVELDNEEVDINETPLLGGYQYQQTSEHSTSAICRFSHLSVQEYLETKQWDIEEAHAFMAGICLRTVLAFQLPDNMGPSKSDQNFGKTDYSDDSDEEQAALDLFISISQRTYRFQVVWPAGSQDVDSGLLSKADAPLDSSSCSHAQNSTFQPPPFQCFCELVHIHSHDDNESCASAEFDTFIEGYPDSGVRDWASYAAQGLASYGGREKSHSHRAIQDLFGTPGQSSSTYQAWMKFLQNPCEKELSSNSPRFKQSFNPTAEPSIGCAILNFDVSLREWLEQKLLNPNTKNKSGDSLLCLAAEHGHYEACKALLDHGADPNVLGTLGSTPLHMVIKRKVQSLIKLFLASGADANLHIPGSMFPLAEATKQGEVEMIMQLLQHGAKVSPHIRGSNTALMWALEGSKTEAASILLSHASKYEESSYKTQVVVAIDSAISDGEVFSTDMIGLLSPYVKQLRISGLLHWLVMRDEFLQAHMLIESGVSVDMLNDRLQTPLLQLCRSKHQGKARWVKQLLEWGANASARDLRGCTPLHLHVQPPRHDAAVDGDQNNYESAELPDSSGETHISPVNNGGGELTTEDSKDTAILNLLKHGADPNAKDHQGMTVLVAACLNFNATPDAIKQLVKGGADVNLEAISAGEALRPLDAVSRHKVEESSDSATNKNQAFAEIEQILISSGAIRATSPGSAEGVLT